MLDSEAQLVKELSELRRGIDALDQQLLALLNQRAHLALEVGEIKRAEGSPVFRPEREAQVIAGLQGHSAQAGGPLKAAHVAAIWREIMSACRDLEAPLRVAYLGPAGTFSEEAALAFFGSAMHSVRCASVDEVFHAAQSGSADFGVVPIENSNEGAVTRSLDLLLSANTTIVGERSLLVRHNLLRHQMGTQGISTVCAHPQALAQCHTWLSAHLPGVERRPVASNAEGARLASLDASVAGIASTRAASEYGLHVVAPAIQDDAHNRTRFAVVAPSDKATAPATSGRDCTSLVVSVANQPGAVHDMLVPLKAHGVSMLRFESRPARSGQWEYYFYIDLLGHHQEPAVAASLNALKAHCAFFKMLGSYALDAR